MKKHLVKIILLVILIGFISCKKKKISTSDNLFKFREYVQYTSSGIISNSKTIEVDFSKNVELFKVGDEIPTSIFSISPSVKGKLQLVNYRKLAFQPENPLKNNTEYKVSIKLSKLFKVAKKFKEYHFSFKTIEQDFIVNTNDLQSYSKDWQYINGSIRLNDIINVEKIKDIVTATQKGKKLKIKWEDGVVNSNFFSFKIDSVQRFKDDSEVIIKWNGEKINLANKAENKFTILGKNNFSVVGIQTEQKPEQVLKINFSDPLKKQQNLKGLVSVKGTSNIKYVVDGNTLLVYPNKRIIGNINVEIFKGITSIDGYKLKNGFSKMVSFEQLKPKIELVDSGTILPNSANLRVNFRAVNLEKVDVRIIKIYENNVLQFLQNNNIDSNNEYEIRRVGRRIAKKTITLINNKLENTGQFKTYAVDLSKLINVEPGAIYRVEFSMKKAYSLYDCENATNSNDDNEDEEDYYEEDYYEDDYYYDDNRNYTAQEAKDLEEREEQYWDNLIYSYKNNNYYSYRDRKNPCKEAYYHNDRQIVSQNVIATNLGVVVKKGNNKNYYFAVTNLLDANPVSGAQVKLYNFQQQEILTTTTDSQGFAYFADDKNAYFAIISKGNNHTYLKLQDGNALSLSKYNVSGKTIKKGLQGYIYGERGIWRPGDTLHLNFILNDKLNKLPQNHPVKMEVTDAKQKLIYQRVLTNGVERFYSFKIATSPNAPTGNWMAKVKVGGATFTKSLKIETIKPNRLKIKLDFGGNVIHAKDDLNATLGVKWLHGAVAKDLKSTVKAKFTNAYHPFKNYTEYNFVDPTKRFHNEEVEIFNGKVDQNGEANINKNVDFSNKAPGMLKATFFTQAYEKGGDFSMDVFSKNYAPFISFVGLKSPKSNYYGSFETDKDNKFKVITVDDTGKPIKRNGLKVKIYEIKWRWWWNSNYENLASYVSNRQHVPYKEFTINSDKNGKASFNVNIPNTKGNRYLIRVIDPRSGHATGRTAYFYRDWWKRNNSDDPEAASMLLFSADKTNYNVGEQAKITFPSGANSRALLSIENGTKVISQQWVKTNKGETTVTLPITKEMAPNVFITISLLQPHANTSNDLPMRLFGLIPLNVEDPKTKLEPVIEMPKELRPEKVFTLKVKEKTGKKMTYTVAVVDEGLLDITRFKTPNAWHEFYKKQALGIKTWDVYDDVIGAYTGSIEQVYAIGGDGEANGKKAKKANRFKPVVMTLGPFTLSAGERKLHKIKMPKYIGSVRTMVVAGEPNNPAYGSAEETTPVKQPLMVLASLPRKLSPGEKVRLPITVFAMNKKIKNATISLKLSNGIKVVGSKSQQLSFSKPDEKMVFFDLDVSQAKGINTIEVLANGNGEKSSYQVEIDVVNPNPITSKMISTTVGPNETKTIDFETFGVKGSNKANIEFSSLPAMNFTNRLDYLIRYPHGCVEQTTSSVFPQLFLPDLFDLPANKVTKIQENVRIAIAKLADFQTPSGGFSYWRGQNTANDWGTSYAGHFLLEAQKKGYVLPISFQSNWLRYQKKAAKEWRARNKSYNTTMAQAYRLYTLALAGQADLSSMNRLREENLSNNAKWRLAAAYALAGQSEVAKKLRNTANIDFKPYRYDYFNYGSPDRNRAMALETMILLKDRPNETMKLAETIAKRLNSNAYMNTQATAYSLYAMSKMLDNNGGKGIDVSYNSKTIQTNKAIAQRGLNVVEGANTITIKNTKDNTVFINVINEGILPLGKEIEVQRGLDVSVNYVDEKGRTIDVSKLKQGTNFVASVTVTNKTSLYVNNIALTQVFPSGWEIINTRFTNFGSVKSSSTDFTDIKDDRINMYFSLGDRKTKTFNVMLNASYLGEYYLYGVQAEAMYDNDYLTRTKGRWIEVKK